MKLSNSNILGILSLVLHKGLKIQSIDFSGNDVGVNGAKYLNLVSQRLRSVKSITVNESNIRCSGASYLWLAFSEEEDSLSLDFLGMRGNGLDVQWAVRINDKLSQPLKVKHLDLGSNLMGDRGAKELQLYFIRNETIQVLDVSHNQISREGMRRLKEMVRYNTNLRKLVLKGNINVMGNIEMIERRERYSDDQEIECF